MTKGHDFRLFFESMMNNFVPLCLCASVALCFLLIGCGGGGGTREDLSNQGGTGSGPEIPPAAGLIPNTFIVEVKTSGSSKSQIEQEIRDAALACELLLGGKVKHLLTEAMHGFVMVLPEGVNPDRFFEYRRVLRVEQDGEAAADRVSSVGLAVDIAVQHVPAGVRRIFADDKSLMARIDGIDGPGERVGVGIAILDSGIDLDHPDLNVSPLGVDFTASPLGADDVFGHGTHVAGIAAALDNAFGVVGVAPGATLYPVKVLDNYGRGATSTIIAGLDWVVANADKIAVANMSLNLAYTSNLLRNAVSSAVAAGVVVVASAGNRGVDVYGPDGIFDTADDRAPSCFPEILAVSAMADFDGWPGGLASGTVVPDDTLVSYSNFSRSLYPGAPYTSPGMAIGLAAPGYAVLSTIPGGLYDRKSGTSMAAPHVAGAVARLIAVRGRDFNLDGVVDAADVTAIRQTLVNGGQSQTLWRQGWSTLDPDGNPEPLVDARVR